MQVSVIFSSAAGYFTVDEATVAEAVDEPMAPPVVETAEIVVLTL